MESLFNHDDDTLQSQSRYDEEVIQVEHKKEAEIDGNRGESEANPLL